MLKLIQIPCGPGGRAVWVFTLQIAGGPLVISPPCLRRSEADNAMGDEVLCWLWDLENVQGFEGEFFEVIRADA